MTGFALQVDLRPAFSGSHIITTDHGFCTPALRWVADFRCLAPNVRARFPACCRYCRDFIGNFFFADAIDRPVPAHCWTGLSAVAPGVPSPAWQSLARRLTFQNLLTALTGLSLRQQNTTATLRAILPVCMLFSLGTKCLLYCATDYANSVLKAIDLLSGFFGRSGFRNICPGMSASRLYFLSSANTGIPAF